MWNRCVRDVNATEGTEGKGKGEGKRKTERGKTGVSGLSTVLLFSSTHKVLLVRRYFQWSSGRGGRSGAEYKQNIY